MHSHGKVMRVGKRQLSANNNVGEMVKGLAKLRIGDSVGSAIQGKEILNWSRDLEEAKLSLHELIDSLITIEELQNMSEVFVGALVHSSLRKSLIDVFGSRGEDLIPTWDNNVNHIVNLPTLSLPIKDARNDYCERLHKVVNRFGRCEIDYLMKSYAPLAENQGETRELQHDLETVWIEIWRFTGLQNVLARFRYLSKFHFRLSQSKKFLSSLRHVSFTGSQTKNVSNPVLYIAQNNCFSKHLTQLSFVSLSFLDESGCLLLSRAFSHSSLKKLVISRCPRISVQGFKYLSNAINTLTHLKLSGPSIESEGIAFMVEESKLTLENVSLGFCKGSFKELVSISCPKLETLSIACCHSFQDNNVYSFMSQCKSLESIRLYEQSVSSSTALRLPQLSSLELINLPSMLCTHVSMFASTRLVFLDLSFGTVNATILQSVWTCFPNLKTLLLEDSRNLFSIPVAPASIVNSLDHLDLSRCVMLEDSAMKVLSQFQLKSLKQDSLCFLSDQGIETLLRQSPLRSTLRKLSVRGCHKVTHRVFQWTCFLEYFDTTSCSRIHL